MYSKIKFALIAFAVAAPAAHAYQIDMGRTSFKLTGYATSGVIEPDFDTPNFIGDWRARGEMDFDATASQKIGAVYAIDTSAVDEERYMREGFVFWQHRDFGRVELGFTDSVARKLGVGLPDVGGLRVNDKPLFYKKISPKGVVISDGVISTGRTALRGNVVSMPKNGVQYGLSAAGLTDDYDYSIDGALKIRQSAGKLKTAYAIGASFMDKPNGFHTDSFTPDVYADWRAQFATGFNLQYNSWILGLDARLIYDENPIGQVSDGLVVGTGVSYDLLNYSVSLTYLMSNTGIWHRDAPDYMDHTAVGSFRYKYSENVDLWMSLGWTSDTPFFAVALRLTI